MKKKTDLRFAVAWNDFLLMANSLVNIYTFTMHFDVFD